MGIETIILIVGLIVVVLIWQLVGKSKRSGSPPNDPNTQSKTKS